MTTCFPLRLWQVFVISVSFIGVLVSILVPNQLKATEILMVIATPSFILSGFTWPLSNASLGSGHFNVIPHSFSESFSGFDY
jgi:ABC-2 type transport system permease protein